jgi:hypothetical protein
MIKSWLVLFIVTLALSAGVANAQNVDHIDSATVNLATDTGTTISSVSSSGTLTGVACKVTSAVSGTPFWALMVTVDGGTAQEVQGGAYLYTTYWWPVNFISVGDGSAVGDLFYIPMHVPFSTSLLVKTSPLNSGTGGLTCSAFRT